MSYLYSFSSDTGCVGQGAPKLIPASGNNKSKKSPDYLAADAIGMPSNGMIDVVNDFQWTTSPKTSRADVPYIEFREKKLKTNALIAAALYYTASVTSGIGQLGARAEGVFNSLGFSASDITGSISNFFNNSLGSKLKQAGSAFLGGAGAVGSALGNSATRLLANNDLQGTLQNITYDGLGSKYLQSYDGLYITEDTKFMYRFPYFEDSAMSVSNSFSDTDSEVFSSDKGAMMTGGLSQMTESLRSLATNFAKTLNILEPGIYIERPKFYSFNNGGDTINFSFPLINTGASNYNDLLRNWQLIYMLAYQNRPNRKTRELIDPPSIYEVNIPGVKYIPFGYINSMTVSFQGSRREYKIQVPSPNGGIASIRTIIPDAYLVNITVTSLVAESQNFLASLLGDKQNIVSVAPSQVDPIAAIGKAFTESYNRDRANAGGQGQ